MDLEKWITTNPIWDVLTETFDLLSARPFENLVFRPESQGGQIWFFLEKWPPYFWKPLTCRYVAAGASFFSRKVAPRFLKPWTCGYVAAGAFFSQNLGTKIFGTARIHQIWARHSTGRPCSKTYANILTCFFSFSGQCKTWLEMAWKRVRKCFSY